MHDPTNTSNGAARSNHSAQSDEHATGAPHAEHEQGQDHEHGQGHGDHAAMFRNRFWLTLVLSAPVVLGSRTVLQLWGVEQPVWAAWLVPLLGALIYVYGGWPFLTGAVDELRARQPGMMTLVALAITVAFVASVLSSLAVVGAALDFWWELALLVVIMLLGHWLEMRALGQASGSLQALAELLPDTTERVDPAGNTAEVRRDDLRPGDVALVRPGGRVPADGTVLSGTATVDESMITGESQPVWRTAEARVVAGTVATDSALRVRIDAVGENTALAGIRRMVAEAQRSRSRAQNLADRAAAALFYFATGVGVLTFGVWVTLGQSGTAVERAVTVLVIACPHALGLAIPLVVAISTTMSARAGILVRDRLSLERMRLVDTVLFDKTGTLTRGEPVVIDSAVTNGATEADLFALAGAAEAESEHPLARAVLAAARERGHTDRTATEFQSVTGRGVTAVVDGEHIAVGGPALLSARGLDVPADVEEAMRATTEAGATVLYVVRAEQVIGALGLADAARPESGEAVAELHAAGARVAMLTGDSANVAQAIAQELHVDEVFAEVLPEDKANSVANLQERGSRVAMVGDGVNDAPALARADVGIAIGAGTDVAVESAGVVLAADDPRGVLAIHRLSRASYRKMVQNLAWAAGYNVVAVPLAAGVLAGIGFVLPVAVGAIVMSLSTILVAANAQLLRRVRLSATAPAQTAG